MLLGPISQDHSCRCKTSRPWCQTFQTWCVVFRIIVCPSSKMPMVVLPLNLVLPLILFAGCRMAFGFRKQLSTDLSLTLCGMLDVLSTPMLRISLLLGSDSANSVDIGISHRQTSLLVVRPRWCCPYWIYIFYKLHAPAFPSPGLLIYKIEPATGEHVILDVWSKNNNSPFRTK